MTRWVIKSSHQVRVQMYLMPTFPDMNNVPDLTDSVLYPDVPQWVLDYVTNGNIYAEQVGPDAYWVLDFENHSYRPMILLSTTPYYFMIEMNSAENYAEREVMPYPSYFPEWELSNVALEVEDDYDPPVTPPL